MSQSKSVLITGGTGNIGSQLVSDLLADGFQVVTTSHSESNIKLFQDKFKNYDQDGLLHFIKVDLEEQDSSQQILSYLDNNNLQIESLINNARNTNYLKLNENNEVDRTNWSGEFLLDVVVAYELSMALTNINNSKLKNIINISSMYGMVAPTPALYKDFKKESPVNYGVAKAALIQLSKELAVRLADNNIRVNCISYGGVEGRADESFKKRYGKYCPAGRMLKRNEVYGAINFLLSEGSSGMTGHNLVIDGGWTTW
ncbi:MAG: SDR family oxidoreductase [candidate division Zixibacteria bacterium]|nr:SDR family oxidoreductase [candidate division Zixibacteria bacterium]